jgi:hypothetical protein
MANRYRDCGSDIEQEIGAEKLQRTCVCGAECTKESQREDRRLQYLHVLAEYTRVCLIRNETDTKEIFL